jgi:hypothetical protein
VTEVEPDLATSREGYMDEMLLGKEKVFLKTLTLNSKPTLNFKP